MRVEITAEQEATYLACHGAKCLNCGSSNINSGPIDIDGVGIAAVKCDDCQAQWNDEIGLVGVSAIDSDDSDDLLTDVKAIATAVGWKLDDLVQLFALFTVASGSERALLNFLYKKRKEVEEDKE